MTNQPTFKSKLIPVGAVLFSGAAGLLAGFVGGFWLNSLDDQSPLSYGAGTGVASVICGMVATGAMSVDEAKKIPDLWWETAAKKKNNLDRHQFNLGFNETATTSHCFAADK